MHSVSNQITVQQKWWDAGLCYCQSGPVISLHNYHCVFITAALWATVKSSCTNQTTESPEEDTVRHKHTNTLIQVWIHTHTHIYTCVCVCVFRFSYIFTVITLEYLQCEDEQWWTDELSVRQTEMSLWFMKKKRDSHEMVQKASVIKDRKDSHTHTHTHSSTVIWHM